MTPHTCAATFGRNLLAAAARIARCCMRTCAWRVRDVPMAPSMRHGVASQVDHAPPRGERAAGDIAGTTVVSVSSVRVDRSYNKVAEIRT